MRFSRLLVAAVLTAAAIAPARAQTNPGLTNDQVLTAGQWNALFAGKQDTLGFIPLNSQGGAMSGRLVTAASGATLAGFNMTPGNVPANPADGDVWVTSSGIFVRVGGTTIGPLSGATLGSFAATAPLTVAFVGGLTTYACATCGVTNNPLSQFATTTSAQLAGLISDETGSGSLVFGTSPTLVTPTLNSATLNSPTMTTPTLGIATGTSLALGGATIGTNALAVTGTSAFGGAVSTNGGLTVTSSFVAIGLVDFSDLASSSIATTAQYDAGAADVIVPASVIYPAETTTTFGTTTTFDFNTFINTSVTLTGNITTMNVTNVKAGKAGTIAFINDPVGGRTTVWNSVFKFAGGATPSLSTGANAVDVLTYSCRSATFCVASLLNQVQ